MTKLETLLDRIVRYVLKHEGDITVLQEGGAMPPAGEKTSPFKGKTAVCIGDSITADGTYVNPLGQLLGTANMINAGTGGQAYTGGFFEDTINGLSAAPDLIVLAGGVNDFRGDKPLGALADCYTTPYSANPRKTDSDITNATFYGAFYRAVYAALTKFPNAKLCVVTPYNNPESKYGNHLESPAATPGWPKYNTPNAGGKVLHDYVMAMKQVASMFGIPAADVNAESGINFATDKRYLTDGIHCTAAGGQVMAKVIFSKIMGTEYFFN